MLAATCTTREKETQFDYLQTWETTLRTNDTRKDTFSSKISLGDFPRPLEVNHPTKSKFTFFWPHSHTHSLQLFPPTLQLFLTVFKKLKEKCAAAGAPPPQVGGLVAGHFSAAFLIAGCVGGREQKGKEAGRLRKGAHQSEWEANSPFPPTHMQLYANENLTQ